MDSGIAAPHIAASAARSAGARRRRVRAPAGSGGCARRGATAKIEKELQSRLDESLARAIQEQEGGGAAAAVPDDVC